MTIVVACKDEYGVTLGADSLGVAGYFTSERIDEKIFETHGIGYGFTSSFRMGDILRYHSEEVEDELRETDLRGYVVKCLVPMWRRILSEHGFTTIRENVETGGTFLVVIDGEIFQIDKDFQVGSPVEPYACVGCGEELAYGALYALHSVGEDLSTFEMVECSVNAAIAFSAGCGGDINFLTWEHEE